MCATHLGMMINFHLVFVEFIITTKAAARNSTIQLYLFSQKGGRESTSLDVIERNMIQVNNS